jgi:hypothetical protein
MRTWVTLQKEVRQTTYQRKRGGVDLPLNAGKFTLLLNKENVGVAPSASGMLAVTTTTVSGVVQTLPTGESRLMLVYGYVEVATHMDIYITGETTRH